MSEVVEELKSQVDFLKDENRKLKNIILQLKRDKFGSKSETHIEEIAQLLFNEFESEYKNAPQLPLEQEQITYTRRKGKQARKDFPENLEREEVVIDLAEENKFCPHDGTKLIEVGEERVEKLITIPAQTKVRIEVKKKYACRCCESYMAQAKTNSILPKTIATPEILSYICFSKFFQSLPLYRLEELYKHQGIELSRGTMARWMLQVSDKLVPIWNLLEEKALASGYVAIDATTVQVLKEKDRAPQDKSFMWVRGSPELGIVLFDYHRSGAGAVAKQLMEGFKGAIQGDAHRGYRAIDLEGKTLLGCMMHARRRFHRAWVNGGKKKQSLADTGLQMIKRLYRFEAAYKEQSLTPEQRFEARREEVEPYLIKIRRWCEKKVNRVPKSSDIGIAMNYFINEFDELAGFLKSGRYEIDNGWIERQIKHFAIGRKNWLFADTVAGANASSILYSLMLTAKLNEKDPFETMAEVFRRIPSCKSISDYELVTNLFLKARVG